MTDIKSPEERSRNMSKIRSKDTKSEEYIRKRLFERGYRYRKNCSLMFGHPDIWMGRYNTAVFVNGCFWHRHEGCKYAYSPKSRIEFWNDKFCKNIERDRMVKRELTEQGKRILIIWECTVKKMVKDKGFYDDIMNKIEIFLGSDSIYMEL